MELSGINSATGSSQLSRLPRLRRQRATQTERIPLLADPSLGPLQLSPSWADQRVPSSWPSPCLCPSPRCASSICSRVIIAEDERQRIVKCANDGRKAARARGVHLGRKPKLGFNQQQVARERMVTGQSAKFRSTPNHTRLPDSMYRSNSASSSKVNLAEFTGTCWRRPRGGSRAHREDVALTIALPPGRVTHQPVESTSWFAVGQKCMGPRVELHHRNLDC
jgi:hypothetical protein